MIIESIEDLKLLQRALLHLKPNNDKEKNRASQILDALEARISRLES